MSATSILPASFSATVPVVLSGARPLIVIRDCEPASSFATIFALWPSKLRELRMLTAGSPCAA